MCLNYRPTVAVVRHADGHTLIIIIIIVIIIIKMRACAAGGMRSTEGKTLANDYGCKYTEVSAILNHKVDDLLVGMLKQIRLYAEQQRRQPRRRRDRSSQHAGAAATTHDDQATTAGCLTKARNRVLAKLLRVGGSKSRAGASKSCENLLSL